MSFEKGAQLILRAQSYRTLNVLAKPLVALYAVVKLSTIAMVGAGQEIKVTL
jgi:hypothetical protein